MDMDILSKSRRKYYKMIRQAKSNTLKISLSSHIRTNVTLYSTIS